MPNRHPSTYLCAADGVSLVLHEVLVVMAEAVQAVDQQLLSSSGNKVLLMVG